MDHDVYEFIEENFKEEMKEKAKQIENVKVFIEGKTIIKEIVISKKLVNIVVQ